jgi:hypothetical protein
LLSFAKAVIYFNLPNLLPESDNNGKKSFGHRPSLLEGGFRKAKHAKRGYYAV